MQQTFIKTIQGHTLEINRLLYPVRYKILSQEFEEPGLILLVNKDENGMWSINSLDKLPGWVSEITADVYESIEENESSLNVRF